MVVRLQGIYCTNLRQIPSHFALLANQDPDKSTLKLIPSLLQGFRLYLCRLANLLLS